MENCVRIAADASQSAAGYVNLNFSDQAKKRTAALTVPIPHAFIAEEIRWFLEDYAQRNPFDGERADDAKDALFEQAKNLAYWIHTSQVLDMTTAKGTLLVEVEDSPEMPSSMLWEALEHKAAIPSLANFDAVIVTRVFVNCTAGSQPNYKNLNDEKLPKLNVLIVSSRRNFEADIPHRLVVDTILSSLDMVRQAEALAMEDAAVKLGVSAADVPRFTDKMNVEVINPATFKAFQSHLESREPGYFDLVHLDLHGVEENGYVALSFMKLETSGVPRCVPDDRKAMQIGELMKKHQVRRVILNACRSAKQFSSGASIPRILRIYGVTEVVAMSYNITSRGVRYFTFLLYALLFGCQSLEFATWYARQLMLRNAGRLSRIGTEVRIVDHIVPRYYRADECSQRADLFKAMSSELPEVPDMDEQPGDVLQNCFGRDHDLLKLSCMLLEGDRPVLVVGEPGIGKTVMLTNLIAWWRTTRCVEAAHHVQLSQDEAFTVERMCRQLHDKFYCPGAYEGPDSVVSFLKGKRYLVVIDSLESMTVDNLTSVEEQRGLLRKFIRKLQGGKTLLVLSSRRDFPMFSQLTRPFHLFGLDTLPALQFMRFLLNCQKVIALERDRNPAIENVRKATLDHLGWGKETEEYQHMQKSFQRTDSGLLGMYANWDKEEDALYLEEICKMVDGHPLALWLLTSFLIVLGPDISPKAYFFSLLQGQPILNCIDIFPPDVLELTGLVEGVRSLQEAINVLSDYHYVNGPLPNSLIAGLSVFWKTFPRRHLFMFDKFRFNEHKKCGEISLEQLEEQIREIGSGSAGGLSGSKRDTLIDLLTKIKPNDPVKTELDAEFAKVFKWLTKEPEAEILMDMGRTSIRKNMVAEYPGAADEIDRALDSFGSIHDVFFHIVKATDPDKAEAYEQILQMGRSAVDEGLEALAELRLVQRLAPEELPPGTSDMEYFKISPIVTIMLRSRELWAKDEEHANSCRVALTLLYSRLCRNWPPPSPRSSSGSCVAAKAVADLEFYNLASAAACSLDPRLARKAPVLEGQMLSLIMNLEWGLMSDATRTPVLQTVWESCFEAFEEEVKSIEKGKDRPVQKNWLQSLRSGGLFGKDKTTEEQIQIETMAFIMGRATHNGGLSEEQFRTETQLFNRRRACLALAMSLLKFYNHFEDGRRRKCVESIKYMTKGLKTDTYPLRGLSVVLKACSPLMEFAKAYADSTVGFLPFNLRGVHQNINKIVQSELMPALTAASGNGSSLSSDEGLGDGMAQTAYLSSITKFQNTVKEIYQLFKAERYDDALTLIDSTFDAEITHGENDAGRRSALLFFRSMINFKQQRFADALSNLDESRRLADLAGDRSTHFAPFRMYVDVMRRCLVWLVRVDARSSRHQGPKLVPCSSCGMARATRRCMGCLYSGYCSSKCQKMHWKEHKKICKTVFSGWCL